MACLLPCTSNVESAVAAQSGEWPDRPGYPQTAPGSATLCSFRGNVTVGVTARLRPSCWDGSLGESDELYLHESQSMSGIGVLHPIPGLWGARECRSRWLRARDLNLHLDFQERMIAADSLLRLASSPMVASLQRHLTTAAVEGRTRSDWITAPDICWSSACQESCRFARQGACYRSTAACRGVFSASIDPFPDSVSLVCASQLRALMCAAFIQETISTGTPIERPSSRSARP